MKLADRIDLAPVIAPVPASPLVSATPYVCRDPRSLPPRSWIYGRQFLRGSLSVVLAPGAIGKTSLLVGTALAIATGRALLGKTPWEGAQRVWLWNLEDNKEELSKLIEAVRLHYQIDEGEIGGRLFVDSALEGAELCTATEDNTGFRILEPVIDALVDELVERKIDVLIVDPFVSSHRVSENNNGAIDAVAKKWVRVAVRANCAVCLVHHTPKLNGAEATAEKSRGAVSLPNASRSVIALNRMTAEEASTLQVTGEDRRRFFRAYDDKNNRAPPADASDWYQLLSVDLGNATADRPSDHIGVVAQWTPPDLFTGVTVNHLLEVQGLVAEGNYRRSEQTDDWVGDAIGQVLNIDVGDRKSSEAKRVKRLIDSWIANGALVVVREKDESRKERPFVRVGTPATDSASP